MNLKEMVGNKSAEFVQDGMTVGLGTGSTAWYMVEALAKRLKNEDLHVQCVTTSNKTYAHAIEVGIPMKELDEVGAIDLTIDGADEIDKNFQGIKGGGGALLYEKIVASYSKKVVWIVDESKLVDALGAFPLPVEVIPFGADHLFTLLEQKNYHPEFRKNAEGELFLTDQKNWIIDLHLEKITDPQALAAELIALPGVVEQGLFLEMVTTVIVGSESGVQVIDAK